MEQQLSILAITIWCSFFIAWTQTLVQLYASDKRSALTWVFALGGTILALSLGALFWWAGWTAAVVALVASGVLATLGIEYRRFQIAVDTRVHPGRFPGAEKAIRVASLSQEIATQLARDADEIERLLRKFFYTAVAQVAGARPEPGTTRVRLDGEPLEWCMPEGESAYLLHTLTQALSGFRARLKDAPWFDFNKYDVEPAFGALHSRLQGFSPEADNEQRRFLEYQDVINQVTTTWGIVKASLSEAYRSQGLRWPGPSLPYSLVGHFYDATTSWVPCYYYWIKPLEEATANRPLKNVLFQHPQLKAPSQVIYRIRGLPDDSSAFALRFGYGIVKAYFDPFLATQVENTSFQQEKDHIRFNIRVAGRTTKEWQGDCYYHHWTLGQEVKPIEARAGGEIEVYLATDCCGVETGNWAAWADPVLDVC